MKYVTECEAVPVRYEFAYGGQCIVGANALDGHRVPRKFILTPEQAALHPNVAAGGIAPLAHIAFDPNPFGSGFAQAWHLRYGRQKEIEAPSIEVADTMLKARQFWRFLAPSRQPECEALFRTPAGFGTLPKSHPHRRAMVGTVDAKFIASGTPLPDDFDFAIWNAAPRDQQIEYPTGGEEIELVNLCAAGSSGTRTDEGKNVYLRLRLPSDHCVLRLQAADGNKSLLPMALDTIVIETEDLTVSLVWRRTIPFEEADFVATNYSANQ